MDSFAVTSSLLGILIVNVIRHVVGKYSGWKKYLALFISLVTTFTILGFIYAKDMNHFLGNIYSIDFWLLPAGIYFFIAYFMYLSDQVKDIT